MAAIPQTEYGYGVPGLPPNVSVVSDYFCVSYPVDLIVKKKSKGLIDARFEIVDIKGNLLLQVDGASKNLQKKRILRDPSGYALLTMREKALSLHDKWTVHSGESSDQRDLIFRVQRSRPLQLKTRLEVFLQSNQSRDVGNFRVIGSYGDGSAKVYRGDALIAEAIDKSTFGGFFDGREDFAVKVYPSVDYAFIAVLLVIYNETDDIFT